MRPNSDVHAMNRREISGPRRFTLKRPLVLFLLTAVGISLVEKAAATIQWQRSAEAIACQQDGKTLWQFTFATNKAKPFIHPLCVNGSESLTASQPSDHRWHYGLWFSWKYINHVNYWEEDKKTGKAEGATKWDPPQITTQEDGSAKITMNLRYISTNDHVTMTEQRDIVFSAPTKDGGVTIDWTGRFKAGEEELVLDRTPMPGEPNGAVNGGYAGFAFRAAQTPAKCDFVTTEAPVADWKTDRARPNSKAAACNITKDGRTDGAAIFSAVSNTGGDSPWYMVNSTSMHWFSPSLLAPAPKKVQPHESFTWKFRVVTKAGAWTPEQLAEQSKAYEKSK